MSEFMSQQTQIERVVPKYLEWIERWPAPSRLAREAPGEAVRAWGRLGYPRRALWLHEAAVAIATRHGDSVPRSIDDLLTLKGVGPYTARAVAVFAYGDRHPVVDTNTRRVLARLVHGREAAGMPHARDLNDLLEILPAGISEAAEFNAAIMELGATVCVANKPACEACPLTTYCRWRRDGYPRNAPAKRPKQARFDGSDRMARGMLLAALRSSPNPILVRELLQEVSNPEQAERALASLVQDGLVVETTGRVRLP